MCIIACKNFNVSSLDWKKIENMYINNPDGAGVAWIRKGENMVNYTKGFMKYEAFRSYLEKLTKKTDLKNIALMLHFRITTHGGTSAPNTHPFPISNNIGNLCKLSGKQKVVVAMNGIVNVDMPKKSKHSDTMEYIVSTMYNIYRLNSTFYTHKNGINLLENTGVKWAFLDKDGTHCIGDYNQLDGWNYSNYSYQSYFTYYGNYSKWCDESSILPHDEKPAMLSEYTLPFYGCVEIKDGELVEIDTLDDIVIDNDNKLYWYSYDNDVYYKCINIINVYDYNLYPTSYNRLLFEVEENGR